MVEILDANRAAPTKGHDSDRPARKKTLPVILTRRTDSRPMVNMPHMYSRIIATSSAGIVSVGCMAWLICRLPCRHLMGRRYKDVCIVGDIPSLCDAGWSYRSLGSLRCGRYELRSELV